jgi:hypothetical protein
LFAHHLLSTETLKLIRALGRAGLSPQRVAIFLAEEKQIRLSSHQISAVMRRSREEDHVLESDELIDFITRVGGFYAVQEFEEEGIVVRSAVATFTPEEQSNLERFGDVVGIDPTFAPTSLNWSLVPITVVGQSREIHCAGLIFCARTTAETFNWILHLLAHVLPSSAKLETIISDDDQALDSAFALNRDPVIARKGRVICFWHKLQRFMQIATRSKQTEKVQLFTKMAMTRDPDQCDRYLELLQDHASPEMMRFLRDSVMSKLHLITKSRNRAFNLGYITSSIAESLNARVKSNISGRNMTLTELRREVITSEAMMATNREYLSARPNRSQNPVVVDELIRDLRVSKPIAVGIAHSLQKARILNVLPRDADSVFDVRQMQWGQPDSIFIVRIAPDITCSCAKVETVGVPCSHICAVLAFIDKLPRLGELVHDRWRLDADQVHQERASLASPVLDMPETLRTSGLSTKQRYASLMGDAASIAAHACKSAPHYDEMRTALSTLASHILQPAGDNERPVRELSGVRPGRPGRHRVRTEAAGRGGGSHCIICGAPHRSMQCPKLPEVYALREPSDERPDGQRQCFLCRYLGHNSTTCPALRRYRALQDPEQAIRGSNRGDNSPDAGGGPCVLEANRVMDEDEDDLDERDRELVDEDARLARERWEDIQRSRQQLQRELTELLENNSE